MIKIFNGLPHEVEKNINEFLKTQDVYIQNLTHSESQGEDGFAITVLIVYETNETSIYSLSEIKEKGKEIFENLISNQIEEWIKTDEEIYDDLLMNYVTLQSKYKKLSSKIKEDLND